LTYVDVEIDTIGNVFILGGSFSKNKKRDVYVLSTNGEHLTTFTLDEPTHMIYIDSENNLFSRAELGTCLKKYEIIYH
jgi:hypothetical protein